jgi:15-cis-phytoene synthase
MATHALEASPTLLQASHRTLRRKARTFHLASHLLPRSMRDDAALVYAFCRLVDDTVDDATDPHAAEAALNRLGAELEGEVAARPLVAALRAAAVRLELPIGAAAELIEGVRSDLGSVRVRDDEELLRYCYRVAGTVGLMMCAVLRVRRREALPHAVDLGIAMQLTNIARDVAEDARRGRVYLPATRLRHAGAEPETLLNGSVEPEMLLNGSAQPERRAVAAVVAEVLELADTYYRSADGGLRDLPWQARQAILVASRVYRAIGLRLRRRACDALAGRTVVPWTGKLLWTSGALLAGLRPGILGLTPRRPHDPALHRALRGLPGANRRRGTG